MSNPPFVNALPLFFTLFLTMTVGISLCSIPTLQQLTLLSLRCSQAALRAFLFNAFHARYDA